MHDCHIFLGFCMMGLKKAAVVVQAIVFLQGCSTLSELPSCDSSEVKDVVAEVIGADYINGSACIVTTDKGFIYSMIYDAVTAVPDASKCDEGTVQMTESHAGNDYKPVIVNVKTVYVDDMVSNFSKYVIRSQQKSSDNLSIACSFSLELERKSAQADWSDSREIQKKLNLTLFKKDESGNRHYEYLWE